MRTDVRRMILSALFIASCSNSIKSRPLPSSALPPRLPDATKHWPDFLHWQNCSSSASSVGMLSDARPEWSLFNTSESMFHISGIMYSCSSIDNYCFPLFPSEESCGILGSADADSPSSVEEYRSIVCGTRIIEYDISILNTIEIKFQEAKLSLLPPKCHQ